MKETHPLKGRKQNPEHVAKRARKCLPDCTCGRHKVSAEAREKLRKSTKESWERGIWEGRSEKTAATWASKTPEEKAEQARKISEGQKANWAKAKAEGRRRNRHYGTRKRTSKHELALVPYMKALGYEHDTGKRIGHKIPDFIDEEGKRIYEYFGTYWHPDPDEERRTVEFYALRGWQCEVLWEDNLFDWLSQHKELVGEEQHAAAWKAAHVNNGYKKP